MSNSKNNFESSLKKLEKIVAKLEEGNIDLDDSIKSFEEGVMLVKAVSYTHLTLPTILLV